jgi:DNA repair exonuclease SbcCD ATPase subunit
MKTNVLSEQVNEIMSQAFWGKSGVRLSENTEVVETPVSSDTSKIQSSEEVVNEETHSCPLCESALEEPVSDEKLTEHIEMMLGIINEMNDISDEELEAIEEEIDEELNEDDDEDDQPEVVEGKMPKELLGKFKGKKSGMKSLGKSCG